jgi:hypothetical protein
VLDLDGADATIAFVGEPEEELASAKVVVAPFCTRLTTGMEAVVDATAEADAEAELEGTGLVLAPPPTSTLLAGVCPTTG